MSLDLGGISQLLLLQPGAELQLAGLRVSGGDCRRRRRRILAAAAPGAGTACRVSATPCRYLQALPPPGASWRMCQHRPAGWCCSPPSTLSQELRCGLLRDAALLAVASAQQFNMVVASRAGQAITHSMLVQTAPPWLLQQLQVELRNLSLALPASELCVDGAVAGEQLDSQPVIDAASGAAGGLLGRLFLSLQSSEALP